MNRLAEEMSAWALGVYLAVSQHHVVGGGRRHWRRQQAQGFIEFALLVVVMVAVASIGLAMLGTDLQALFETLGKKLQMPSGF